MSQLINPFCHFEFQHGEVVTFTPEALQPNRIPVPLVVVERHLVEDPDGSFRKVYRMRGDDAVGHTYSVDAQEDQIVSYPCLIHLAPTQPVCRGECPDGMKSCPDKGDKP